MSEEKHLTIPYYFDQVVGRDPQRPAAQIQINGQWQTWDYGQWQAEARGLAAFLLRRGMRKQDYGCIILENRPEWGTVYLALMYAGMTAVPLDAQSKGKEIKRFVADCSPRVIFCSRTVLEECLPDEVLAAAELLVVVDAGEICAPNQVSFQEACQATADRHLPQVEPGDDASLIYTSGTTAHPKGVVLTHENIVSNYLSIQALNLCFDTDHFLCFLPYHHTYPFMATFILPLFLGARMTFVTPGFNPRDLARIIREQRITVMVAVPQMLAMIHRSVNQQIVETSRWLRPIVRLLVPQGLKKRFGPQLRLIVSGGARLDQGIARELSRWGLCVTEGYGLTETSPVVTFNPPGKVKFGSVGRALPQVQVRIDQPDENGVGEIWVRGPNVMRGYFRRNDLTDDVLSAGWFHTGDLGFIDDEGYLFITGRKKEMIVLSSGKNVYPQDLEQHLLQSPYIKEICVLERVDNRFGSDRGALYAVILPDLEYFERLKERNIHDKIRWELDNLSRDLPAYQHIMGFTLTRRELPKTSLGKYKRYLIRDKFLGPQAVKAARAAAPVGSPPQADIDADIAQKITDFLSQQLKEPVSLEQHLEIELGIDSLTRVELGMGIERLFTVKIPDEALSRMATVKDVVREITELKAAHQADARYEDQVREVSWSRTLNTPPSREVQDKIQIQTRLIDWLLTGFFWLLFNLLFRILWFYRVESRTAFPREGPYLITPNHASYLDGFLVFCGLPLRIALKTYFVGWGRIFEHPTVRWTNRFARLVPIDTNTNFIASMQVVTFLLRHGKNVCIFPEGQRSISDEVGEFKNGTGILVRELQAKAVPVYIAGSHAAWPRTHKGPHLFKPLKVRFGKTETRTSLLEKTGNSALEDYQEISRNLRRAVLRLK